MELLLNTKNVDPINQEEIKQILLNGNFNID